MNKFWEKFFFFLTFITQGSSYLSGYAYGIMHRMHHTYADTEQDPHSPKYDKNLFAMMWRTKTVYTGIFEKTTQIDDRFTQDVPEWSSFEKFAHHWSARLMWAAIYIAIYYFYAEAWWVWLFLPAQLVMGPLHGAVINWFAHKYGYVNFKVADTSVNLMPLDVFMMGEGYHNNHHKNGTRANFGIKWHEIDPTYQVIKVLNFVGIIKLK